MLKAGTDLFTVSWEMRHADIRTTSITYLEPDQELGRNGVKALDQIVGFLPPPRISGPSTARGRALRSMPEGKA
jgi:hypothetical protein